MGSPVRNLLAALGGLLLVAVLGLAVAGPQKRREWCADVGLCAGPDLVAAMLESVRREQKLIVFSAQLVVPVSSARDTTLGPLTVATTRQTAILPGSVNYGLDLSRLDRNDLAWDPERQQLTVTRPPLRIEEPTIRWDRAQVYSDKGWQTVMTEVGSNLQRDNEAKAPARFQEQARDPELVRLANDAADHALSAVFSMPLNAAGFPEARVVVRRKDG